MLSLGGAAILMINGLKDIAVIFPKNVNWNAFVKLPTEEPFSENAISFLNALASILKSNSQATLFPELLTFAFFCRKANIVQQKKRYYSQKCKRKGRGIVFHISPSNMPLNFAYSLISGILSGNTNLVRLPSKNFTQVDIICQAIQTLSESADFSLFAKRLLLVRYDKFNLANAYFSSICNARVIWGGDKAVHEIRKNRLSATAVDVAFTDKYAVCIIDANTFIHEKTPEKVARLFYNDTFLFDQNACTSPYLIVWLGNKTNCLNAQYLFWNCLYTLVKKHYHFQAHSAIDKLTAFCTQAIYTDGIKKWHMPDNLIWRIELNDLSENFDRVRCNCGYFIEYKTTSLSMLEQIFSKKHQTIAYYGIEQEAWKQLKNVDVIDRIRPIGKTSEFSFTWDGCNLIETLSMSII